MVEMGVLIVDADAQRRQRHLDAAPQQRRGQRHGRDSEQETASVQGHGGEG